MEGGWYEGEFAVINKFIMPRSNHSCLNKNETNHPQEQYKKKDWLMKKHIYFFYLEYLIFLKCICNMYIWQIFNENENIKTYIKTKTTYESF